MRPLNTNVSTYATQVFAFIPGSTHRTVQRRQVAVKTKMFSGSEDTNRFLSFDATEMLPMNERNQNLACKLQQTGFKSCHFVMLVIMQHGFQTQCQTNQILRTATPTTGPLNPFPQQKWASIFSTLLITRTFESRLSCVSHLCHASSSAVAVLLLHFHHFIYTCPLVISLI